MDLTASPRIPTAQRQPALLSRLRTLFAYRELLYHLVVRELRARYKNSLLGVLWSLLNPLAMMLVFSTVFNFIVLRRG
jgi:ABC-type polysaccharide/polyol phosphate export permease